MQTCFDLFLLNEKGTDFVSETSEPFYFLIYLLLCFYNFGYHCPEFLTESLNELEDHDLDALVADLGSKSTTQDLTTHQQNSSLTDDQFAPPAMTQRSEAAAALPQTPNTAGVQQRVTQNLPLITKINFMNVLK